MDFLLTIGTWLGERVWSIAMYPFTASQRIFWLYLLTSVVCAYFVYRAMCSRTDHVTERDAEAAKGSFLGYLFPRHVWSHPSAWLDLRYMVFHKIVSGALIVFTSATGLASGIWLLAPTGTMSEVAAAEMTMQSQDWIFVVVYMFATYLVLDFVSFYLHYLQHKSKFLWQFHKVHHSAEVMHPVSNYREHPVDNVVYSFFNGFVYGMIISASVRLFGSAPSMPTLLGVPLLMFFFNIVGYNLRHSHVWLRWPGVWSVIFPSPAHHHVHHSCHPDHLDKNFAFMFPIWDVIFGTYHMPDDNRDVKFGVTEGDGGEELNSVLRLYWVPFRHAWKALKGEAKGQEPAGGDAPGSDEPTAVSASVTPAE